MAGYATGGYVPKPEDGEPLRLLPGERVLCRVEIQSCNPWICCMCGQRWPVPSLARDCENRHAEENR